MAALALLSCAPVGCDTQGDVPEPDAGAVSDVTDAAPGVASDAGAQSERCRAPEGVSSAPQSVTQVMELVNALPKPLTLPCFLETLQRPLKLRAAHSIFSAQPAVGARSPRIFVFIGPLVLSVVPAGIGAHLLELGEQRSAVNSLKAELEFPVTEQLDAAAPYRRVAFNDAITSCGVCHQGEQLAADVGDPLAVLSAGLQPTPEQHVPLARLMAELASCDASQEPERCALLEALLAPTPAPLEGAFPATFNTFF
jgi:hypothetical protein